MLIAFPHGMKYLARAKQICTCLRRADDQVAKAAAMLAQLRAGIDGSAAVSR
jgi:hypothetical protein